VKDRTDYRFQFDKDPPAGGSPVLNEKQTATGVKSGRRHGFPNRRILEPHVRWCERRTLSLTSGRATYSVGCCFRSVWYSFLIIFTMSVDKQLRTAGRIREMAIMPHYLQILQSHGQIFEVLPNARYALLHYILTIVPP
jgi:hypothetical protein